jgi:hypothetical protein
VSRPAGTGSGKTTKLVPHRKLGKFVRFTEEDLKKIEEATATGDIK